MATTWLGDHELIERLGQGSMGVVWKARDGRSGRVVALKVLREVAGSRRFRREFRAASRLEHPNVVRVFDMGTGTYEGSERPWLTMELIEGTTLREVLDREAAGWPPARNSREWLAARLSLLHQTALGLEHCHSHGVLHRDLKPTNVLLDAHGVVKLVDFGLARLDDRTSSISRAGQLVGTAAYMSPEQARGGPLDARSDVHALGALLHEVACGLPAFRADDLPSLLMKVLFDPPPDPRAGNEVLVPALGELATSCLAKDPLERPQSAAEVSLRLGAIARAEGVDLGTSSRPPGQVGGAPATARVRPLAPQLVGRGEERAELRAALERARQGPVVVLLTGPSGVGKTRLGEELRADAEVLGFRVLASAASTAPRPLGPLRSLLKVALRRAPEEARHDVALLRSVLPAEIRPGRDGPAAPEEADAEDEHGTAGKAAPSDRLRIGWAAEAVLAHLLAGQPHVLLLDDLQWADPLSAQVIEQLAQRDRGPLLLVGIFRDAPAEPAAHRPAAEHLREALAGRPGALRIALHPLDAGGVARLVESMLGKPPAEQDAIELLAATGGMPHDIEQVIRELAARGAVRVEAGRVALLLPPSVKLSKLSASQATRSHLEALGPIARRVVLACTLGGRGIHISTLARALALDEDTLLDELDVLVNEGLLSDGPGADVVSLAHDRLREAVAGDSSGDELGPIRSALARALEREGGAAGLHRVAELDLAAGALDDALRTVPPSAEDFAKAGLHAAALERYEALLALAARAGEPLPPTARARRAELLRESGRTEEAAAAHAELAIDPSAREAIRPLQARAQQAFALMLLTRLEEAIEVLERALEAVSDDDWSGRVRVLSLLGIILDRTDRKRSALLHDEAVRMGRSRGTGSDLALALNNLAVSAYRFGRLAEARAANEEAAPLFDAAGDFLHAANVRLNLATIHLARGQPDECRPIARDALAAMRRAVDVRGLSRVHDVLGLAALDLGDVDEAESELGESMAIRARLDEPWAQGESAVSLAAVAAYRCQWQRAEELLELARDHFARAGDRGREAVVAARRADLAWRAGRKGARALAEAALAAAERGSAPNALTEALLTLARLDADEGRAGEACVRLRHALDGVRELESQEPLSLESELLVCRVLAGDLDGLGREAERVAGRAGRRPAAARMRDALAAAAALRVSGDAGRAAECLDDAQTLLARLRERLPAAERVAFEQQHALARLLALARAPSGEDDVSQAERIELARLRTFHALVMASDPGEPDSLLATFLAGALAELGFARGLIFVGDEGELSCRIARDAGGRDIPAVERRVPDRLLRHALERGEPVFSLGLRDDGAHAYEGSLAELGVEAFAAVPVSAGEAGPGFQVVAYFDGPPPDGDPQARLAALAPVFRDLGLLLERARRVKERTQQADAILASLGGDVSPIIGVSRAVEELRALVRTVAPTDATVVILGENGTGKELVARELHARSLRKDGAMLARSCAELTETLLESELFGHERGAFTGAARDRPGMFEAASGGTLFLDEVGEMSPGLQAKLLRVLESGEVTRVGSRAVRRVDVRVVAATHRDLTAEVQAGRFRQDLYYRLRVIELRVPSLRSRRDDVPLLAHHFLALAAARRPGAPRALTHDALRALTRHDWPGNVRELRNVIERAVILSAGRKEIGLDLLPDELGGRTAAAATPGAVPAAAGSGLFAARDAFEKACIERALEESGGNRTHAAKALGISVRSLQQKLGRHRAS